MGQAAEPVSTIAVSLVFGAVILKLVDLFKYLLNGDVNGLVTLFSGWIAGIVSVFLFLRTEWADEITIGNESLADLSGWSKFVFGLAASSVGAVLYDFKKAVDNSDSAATPKLLGRTSVGQAAEQERVARVESTAPQIHSS